MMGTSPAQRLRLQAVAAEFLEQMGARIRERREFLRLSRAEVARRMPGKVNENQVYRWEKGRHQPNPDTLQALASVLECDVAQFMVASPDKDATPDPFTNGDDLELNDRLTLITEAVAGLDEQIRLLRTELAARDAEVMKRLDEGLPPSQGSQPGPQP